MCNDRSQSLPLVLALGILALVCLTLESDARFGHPEPLPQAVGGGKKQLRIGRDGIHGNDTRFLKSVHFGPAGGHELGKKASKIIWIGPRKETDKEGISNSSIRSSVNVVTAIAWRPIRTSDALVTRPVAGQAQERWIPWVVFDSALSTRQKDAVDYVLATGQLIAAG